MTARVNLMILSGMSEPPSEKAAIAVHREAHGLVADKIIEVKEGL